MKQFKMTIATKYILAEFLPTFFICFIFFFMMFIINHILVIIKPLIEKNLPFDIVMMMIITILPLYTMFSLPFSLLLSSLMTLGRLSSDNEIVAFKSLGFNVSSIFAPLFVTGFIVMIIAFGINDRLRPIGMKAQMETRRKISTIKPTLYFKSKTVKKYSGKVIFTDVVKDRNISGLIIIDKDTDGQKRIIMAKEALFQTPEEMKDAVEIKMQNAMVQFDKKERPQEFNYGFSDTISYYIRFRDFDDSSNQTSISEMKTAFELYGEVQENKVIYTDEINNRDSEYNRNIELIRDTINNMNTNINTNISIYNINNNYKNIDSYVTSMQNMKKNKIKNSFFNRSLIDFYDKFSLPIACLIFVIFGTPMGIYSKRSGYAFGFIIGLFLCGIYWFFYYGMVVMGRKMVTPPFISIFLPNLVFLIIGLILLIKRLRE